MPTNNNAFKPTSISVLAQSEDAVLCLFEEGEDNEQELWVPKSVIEPDDWNENEDAWEECEELSIQQWWLSKNSIE